MLATRRAPGDIRVKTPDFLRPLLTTLQRQAAADLYLVGGAVRDLLRVEIVGKEAPSRPPGTPSAPNDLDFAVKDEAEVVARRIADALGGHVFTMDESRGQMRVVLDEGPIREIDIAPLKGDIESDLRQRDFTVDAMAAPVLADGELGGLIDPWGAVEDIKTKALRLTSEAALRDDPLRLLRAVRLAVELGFEIEADTAAAITKNAPLIHEAAAERERDELVRIFATERAAEGVRLMDAWGLLAELLPELMDARGVSQPENHHYYDVFDHSLETVAALDALLAREAPADARARELRAVFRDGLSGFDIDSYLDETEGGTKRRVLLKLAGLLHDVSKPETKTTDGNGQVRFFGHPEKGARKSEAICRRLRFGNRDCDFVALLVEEHLRPTQLAQRGEAPSQRALYRFFRDLAGAAPPCLILQLADGIAAAGPRLRPERFKGNVAYAAWVLSEHERLRESLPPLKRLVTGNDIMQTLGIAPGPGLGRLLEAVEEAIGAGEISTREEALEYVAALTSPPQSPSPSTERGRPETEAKHRQWQSPPDLWERLRPLAQEMRRKPTKGEEILWQRIRNRQIDGFRFRRQHAIGRFIVDFYCPEAQLVVEVDGPVHQAQTTADAERSALLEERGLRVLRFENARVSGDVDGVLEDLRVALKTAQPRPPSPKSERGKRQQGVRSSTPRPESRPPEASA
jgi:poly(A) polymerase